MTNLLARRTRMTAVAMASHRSTLAASNVGATTAAIRNFCGNAETNKQLKTAETMLEQQHWADVKDEVKEIRSLVNEWKTNHAIKLRGQDVEQNFADDILHTINNGHDHDEAFAHIHALKCQLRQNLYASS